MICYGYVDQKYQEQFVHYNMRFDYFFFELKELTVHYESNVIYYKKRYELQIIENKWKFSFLDQNDLSL